MKKLRYAVVAGGQVSAGEVQKLQKKAKNLLWIAADSGAEVLWKNGIIPHILVGDLDSLSEEALQAISDQGKTEIFRFSPEKDQSDTHLALQVVEILHRGGSQALFSAWQAYYQPESSPKGKRIDKCIGRSHSSHKKPKVVVLGAVGSRLDHSLSNLWILFDFLEQMKLTVWTETSRIRAYSGRQRLSFQKKEEYPFFSILPLSKKLKGLSLKGFSYPLDNQTVLQHQASWLLSNQLAEERAELTIRQGKFLVIRSRD